MPTTAIVWFRRDLRVHDHPALTAAVAEADVVVPVFVIDDVAADRPLARPEPGVVHAREPGRAVRGPRGARRGAADPARPPGRRAPGARARDRCARPVPDPRRRPRTAAGGIARSPHRLAADGVTVHAKRGLYVHEPDEVLTRDGRPFTVYGAFRRAWEARPRRAVLPAPDRIPGPPGARPDRDPGPRRRRRPTRP